jgi:hypothetical protein
MRRILFLLAGLTLALGSALLIVSGSDVTAQELGSDPAGIGFVDENGDGYNDNAPDADGDGIPNGQDPDYERQGVGARRGGRGMNADAPRGFVDEDGDGINDNAPDADGDGIRNCEDPDYTSGAGRRSGRRGRK